jgi:hypothetical protein
MMSTNTWIWISVSCWTLGCLFGTFVTLRICMRQAKASHEHAINELRKLGELSRTEINKAYDERDAFIHRSYR